MCIRDSIGHHVIYIDFTERGKLTASLKKIGFDIIHIDLHAVECQCPYLGNG